MCRHVFRRVTSALTTLLIFGCGDAIPAEALPYGTPVSASVERTGGSEAAAPALTIERALTLGLDRAHEIIAGHAAADAARSSAGVAAQPPPWEVALTLENFAGHGAARGLDVAEGTVELGRTLKPPGKRTRRVAAARAAIDVADAELRGVYGS